jgi:methionine aminopeptidase
VNDEAVHGIPGDRPLQDGDLVKLDVTREKDGFMADAAETKAFAIQASLGSLVSDHWLMWQLARPRFSRYCWW